MARGEPRARGEVAEVRAALAALTAPGGPGGAAARAAARDLFKKIVHYTTVGIDLSSVFMQVVAAAAPCADDVLLKKMLYWYVATYARAAPDLTLLTINLLAKDTANADPALRAAALRTLTALRVPNLVEHAAAPVSAGLGDPHPHVRRAAAAGVLKIFHTAPDAVARAGWLPALSHLVETDPDAGVVAAALAVLRAAGALPPASRSLVIPLLNRVRDFADWGQCLVMDVACGFAPKDEAEVYALLNALDDRLSVTNAAVLLAATKLLLHATLALPATHQALLDRVKDPLLTLAAAGDRPEVAAVALAHLRVLADRAPSLFADAAPLLYPLPSDPAYVADAKLALLVTVADESNVHDIADELTAAAAAPDPARARAAVAALGAVAAAVPSAAGVADRLVGLLDTHADGGGGGGVLAEAVVQAAALVRRAPHSAPAVAAAVDAAGLAPAALDDAAGRAALVWLLGEAGADAPDAPYALAPVASTWADQPRSVRLALLRAAARLFVARPPEAAPLLKTVLAAAADDGDADVRDRGRLYRGLLASTPDAAAAVLAAAPPPPDAAAADAAVADALFAEFDTLAVLARAPAATFIVGGGGASGRAADGGDAAAADFVSTAAPAAVAAAATAPAVDGGLLLVDEILGADEASSALLAGGGDALLGGGDADARPASAASAADPFDVLGGGGTSSGVAPPAQPGLDPLADLLGGGAAAAPARAAAAPADDPFGLGDLLAAAPK